VTRSDRELLARDGYTVLSGLVPDRLLSAASDVICSFVNARLERQERIECWRQERAPAWWRDWKGQVDPEPGAAALLTPLGRRRVGVDRWI
jgi:hypothetical protein